MKGQDRKRMLRDLDKIDRLQQASESMELSLPWSSGPKLLEVILDFFSVFEDHAKALKAKALKRSTIRNNVCSTHWVLESRILDINSHALIESAVTTDLPHVAHI